MGHVNNARQSSNRSFVAASHGAVADGVFGFLIFSTPWTKTNACQRLQKSAWSGTGKMLRPPPVRFESLGLIVKFGHHVTIYEAQCLQIIKRVFNDEIPVPEAYGWRVHNDQVFIYMQLIQGQALIDQWDSLSISDKLVICDQLRGITTSLRSVEQSPDDMFVGML